jgi:iron-sulfur cluster repair protein YtfE (RIC family)
MKQPKPLKRHEALQPLSRQHHFGLLFCWKLRKGFATGIAIERMAAYRDWFFQTEIVPHFAEEEAVVFPILKSGHPLVERALEEHDRLRELFTTQTGIEASLQELESLLQKHIRFEERQLFEAIQEVATPEELRAVASAHQEKSNDEVYEDPFWE